MYKSKIINGKCYGIIKDCGDDFYILDKNNPALPNDAFMSLSGIPNISAKSYNYFKKTIEYKIFISYRDRILKEKLGYTFSPCRDKTKEQRNRYHGLKSYALKSTNIALAGARINADLEAIKLARRFKEDKRGQIYKLAVKSDRVKQFIEVHPVGALYLTCDLLDNGIRERIIQDINNGFKLKSIIDNYNLPDISFRKIKPLAASAFFSHVELSVHVELLKKLINCYLPKTSMQQYRWAIVIKDLLRDNHDSKKIEWIIKNFDFSKKIRNLFTEIIDLNDYINSNENIIGVRKFNPSMSLASALEASKEWHARIVGRRGLGSNISEDTEFAEPWIKEYSDKEYAIIPLTTARDLTQESIDMHHCVSSYARRVVNGECYIYTVIKNKQKVATLELKKESLFAFTGDVNKATQIFTLVDAGPSASPILTTKTSALALQSFTINQLRGPCNNYVDDDVKNMVNRWIYEANNKITTEVAT